MDLKKKTVWRFCDIDLYRENADCVLLHLGVDHLHVCDVNGPSVGCNGPAVGCNGPAVGVHVSHSSNFIHAIRTKKRISEELI